MTSINYREYTNNNKNIDVLNNLINLLKNIENKSLSRENIEIKPLTKENIKIHNNQYKK